MTLLEVAYFSQNWYLRISLKTLLGVQPLFCIRSPDGFLSHSCQSQGNVCYKVIKHRNIQKISKLWYSYLSTLPLASQNTLLCICLYIHLLLKQDIVIQKRYFSKFPTTALQVINPKFISTIVSHMMLQNFRMICHWKIKLLLHYQVSKGDLKLICFRSLFLPRFSYYWTLIVPRWRPYDVSRLMIYELRFGWCALESAGWEIRHLDSWYLMV